METQIGNSILELTQGDITSLNTQAIVNAANAQLILGGGVAGAIRAKGGPKIQQECNQKGPTYVGSAVLTTGGKLNAQYVIHAVGPRMGEGQEDAKLKSATINSLELADQYDITTIAFPAISTGIFGFPRDRCAEIMLGETVTYLKGQTNLQKVVFCLFDRASYRIFSDKLNQLINE